MKANRTEIQPVEFQTTRSVDKEQRQLTKERERINTKQKKGRNLIKSKTDTAATGQQVLASKITFVVFVTSAWL